MVYCRSVFFVSEKSKDIEAALEPRTEFTYLYIKSAFFFIRNNIFFNKKTVDLYSGCERDDCFCRACVY